MSATRNLLQESLAAIERLQARLEASERARHEPIAIVGAGCRYPGGIETPAELWRVVHDGVDAVSEVPPDRWDANAYFDSDAKAHGKMVTRRGGFLGQVDHFDPQFFGISPREAATMDPQQRLLLETASEALESAGLASDRLAGSLTGVFVGITTSDYARLLQAGGPANADVYSATGGALNAAAGRIAFTFGLQGPCVALDTACSSSLVATHLACQSLRAGESDLALAGGVNVVLLPDAMVLFSKWGMLAPDGACKTFDAAADGFVRAEGCAVIALKRLSDAIAAGDPILAVIRGSAVNSDGRSSGLTVPSGPAQRAILRRALADAGLTPTDIDYVEAHGTGTPIGDPIEVEALGVVLGKGRAPDRPLAISSIKTNIGHTEAASGLAGLLKVVMALRHETIPGQLHFSRPNPRISWGDYPIVVPTSPVPWPRRDAPRRGAVSSFGFSGTNAHVILEEAPALASTDDGAATRTALVPLAARDDKALRALALRHAEFLATHAGVSLDDIAATLGAGRAHPLQRAAVVAKTTTDLGLALRLFAKGETPASMAEGRAHPGERPKIAFLFTGQGAQYAGMGRGLYDAEPVFRATIDRAAAALAPVLERPLVDVLFPADGAPTPLGETAYTQPALFALEFALAELWRSWGITPSVVMGHSVGEFVAACVAGVFTFEDGLALIVERGRLMQALPAGGAMAAIFAKAPVVVPLLQAHGGRVSLAAVNGPEETVISGDAAAVDEIVAALTASGVVSRRLEVSHAFHSARLDPMLDAFEQRARAVTHAPPAIALVSNVTGRFFEMGDGPDAAYWRRHAREPVQFLAGVEALREAHVTALLEIGPHPTLLALAGRVAPDAGWVQASSLRRGRDDRREMLGALGKLYVKGAPAQWDAVNAGRGRRRGDLPTYPFQRERFWVTPTVGAAPPTGALEDLFYEVAWQPTVPAQRGKRAAEHGLWFVFADRGGVGDAIAADHADSVQVHQGTGFTFDAKERRATIRPDRDEDYRALFEAGGWPSAIVHLWALDAPADVSGPALATEAMRIVRLVQAAVAGGRGPRPRIWIASSGAHAVVDADLVPAPRAASVWGIGRALAAEHAELWGGLLDLDPQASATASARSIAREVASADGEDKIAFRGTHRFAPRFRRRATGGNGAGFSPRADGTYVLTGGLGGVGLAMARWLVERGARHLLLVGRTPLPPRESWSQVDPASARGRCVAALAAMDSRGARVETAALDVAAMAALADCLATRQQRGEPGVTGVIHAAGVVEFKALVDQDAAGLASLFAGKAEGAWNLHRLFETVPLDCFVLCSSASALFGPPFLGGYAAANLVPRRVGTAPPEAWNACAQRELGHMGRSGNGRRRRTERDWRHGARHRHHVDGARTRGAWRAAQRRRDPGRRRADRLAGSGKHLPGARRGPFLP